MKKIVSIASMFCFGLVLNAQEKIEYVEYDLPNGILFPQTQIMSFGNVTFSGTVKSNQINSDIDFSEFKEK